MEGVEEELEAAAVVLHLPDRPDAAAAPVGGGAEGRRRQREGGRRQKERGGGPPALAKTGARGPWKFGEPKKVRRGLGDDGGGPWAWVM